MDTEKFKDAFDKFIDKKYDESREILNKEIERDINTYFKRELNLEKDVYKIDEE